MDSALAVDARCPHGLPQRGPTFYIRRTGAQVLRRRAQFHLEAKISVVRDQGLRQIIRPFDRISCLTAVARLDPFVEQHE